MKMVPGMKKDGNRLTANRWEVVVDR